ncbi:MAG: hypothetical protein Q4A17_08935 [Thermoguttaceae bacterium]|nr:hypothetical protein [Thermoguttaceae bacterium]
MNESIEKTEMKQKKTNWLYLMAMVLVLILAAVSYMAGHIPEGNTGVEVNQPKESPLSEDQSEKARALEEQFRQKVLQEEKKFQEKNNELLNDFEFKLQEIINRNFDAAENAIPSVVKDFSSFGACNKLCYKMAKDKITGSSDAQEAIEQSLNKVLDHCAVGTVEVDQLLKNYEIKLAENSNEFRASIAAELKKPEFKVLNMSAIEKIAEDMVEIQTTVNRNILSTISAEVGVGLELLFIRSTYQVLSSVLAKTVAKMAGSGTSGVICAAADGPLPIGDVIGGGIAVVGLAWTAWDIRQAIKVIPEKLSGQLHDSITNYRSEINQNAKDQAQKLLNEYRTSTRELVNEVSDGIF